MITMVYTEYAIRSPIESADCDCKEAYGGFQVMPVRQ